MGGSKKKKPTKPSRPGQSGPHDDASQAELVPHRKLYVGNLAGMDMTEVKLRELFEPCGEITLVEFVTTAKHAFGFVEFATVADATGAIDRMSDQSGMLVKYAGNPTPPKSASLTASTREEDDESEEEGNEGETEKVSEEETAEVERVALVHPDPVGAARRNYPNPVEDLQVLVQKATRASSTRDQIIYTVEEVDIEFGEYVATMELRVPAGSHTSRGEPKESKNEAKKTAAQAALRDPDVHRLLPPLPAKAREVKDVKAESSDDEEQDEWAKSCRPCTVAVVSAKKQRQAEKAELRAQKVAKRHAVKAIKAAMAQDEESEESESEDREDSTREDSEDQEGSEEGSEEEVEETSDEDEDSDEGIDAAELAAKKAAIKAALRTASKGRAKSTASAKEKEKEKQKSKLPQADKALRKDQQAAAADKPDVTKQIFSSSKWTQVGSKTAYVKP